MTESVERQIIPSPDKHDEISKITSTATVSNQGAEALKDIVFGSVCLHVIMTNSSPDD